MRVSPWRTALQVLGVSLCHVKYGVASPLDRRRSRTQSEAETSPWAGQSDTRRHVTEAIGVGV